MLDVREYLDEDGGSPFADWFFELDAMAAAKITIVLARIEQGNLSNVKGVGQVCSSTPWISGRATGFTSGATVTCW